MPEPATNMAVDLAMDDAAFYAKYGDYRRNAERAQKLAGPLRVVDAVLSRVEDLRLGARLDAPIDAPVFVTGNFRSGTTLLERVLTSHPDVGHFTYLTTVLPRAPRIASLAYKVVPGFADETVPPHQPNMRVSQEWPFEAEVIWRFCRNNPWTDAASNVLDHTFDDPGFEHLLKRTINKQLLAQQKVRFVNKNPINTVRVGYLAKIFPSARFVHIVRHPLRMLRSQLDMESILRRIFDPRPEIDWGAVFSGLHFPPTRLFPRTPRHAEITAAMAEDRARAVAMSMVDVEACFEAAVAASALEGRLLRVRYEDLLADFTPTMGRIFDFVGLGGDAADRVVREHAERFLTKELRSARAPLPRFDDAVHAALRPMLTTYGYDA